LFFPFFCRQCYAHLVAIESVEENSALTEMLINLGMTSAWTAGGDLGLEDTVRYTLVRGRPTGHASLLTSCRRNVVATFSAVLARLALLFATLHHTHTHMYMLTHTRRCRVLVVLSRDILVRLVCRHPPSDRPFSLPSSFELACLRLCSLMITSTPPPDLTNQKTTPAVSDTSPHTLLYFIHPLFKFEWSAGPAAERIFFTRQTGCKSGSGAR